MEKLLHFATQVNWGYNTQNTTLFKTAGINLYNYTLPVQRGGKILTFLEGQTDTQIVGKAFSYFARFFDNGDSKINSVAAENAFYCLAKSIKCGNTYAAPELFLLLEKRPEAILDKFFEAVMSDIESDNNSLLSLYYYDHHRIRANANKLIPYVKFYLISIFFDIEQQSLKIPDNILNFSINLISTTISHINKIDEYNNAITLGEKTFQKVYSEIEETLQNF